LAKEQFGFRQDSSIDKAIFKLLNEILNALNNKFIVGGIFFDLEKAFDCVNYDILLSKLEFCGITGQAYALIKSYLGERYQRIVIDSNILHCSISSWGKVAKSIPQGSVLGPLLFLVYINDLPSILQNNSIPILFADNTSGLVTNSNPNDFSKDINEVFEYLNKWFNINFYH
jgi:hypothetical protein